MSEFDAVGICRSRSAVRIGGTDARGVRSGSGGHQQRDGHCFQRTHGFVRQHRLSPSGPPRAIYTAYGPQGVRFIAAIPIAKAPAATRMIGPGFVKNLVGSKAMRFTHRGPYADLKKTYGQITEYLKTKGLIKTEAEWSRYMPMWEEYLNDPQTTRRRTCGRTSICP